jgi:hypothetical protein
MEGKMTDEEQLILSKKYLARNVCFIPLGDGRYALLSGGQTREVIHVGPWAELEQFVPALTTAAVTPTFSRKSKLTGAQLNNLLKGLKL